MKKVWTIVISVSAAVLVAGAAGVGGFLVGQNVFAQKKDYSKYDIATVEDDYSDVFNKFKKTDASKYFTTFNEHELANIALLKQKEVENYYSVSKGEVLAAGVTQSIRSNFIKNGNNYFEENISASSFVKVAGRFYQGENIEHFKGDFVDVEKGKYSDDEKIDYSKSEFEEKWGRTLDRGTIYIVSSKTFLDGEVLSNSDNTYSIKLNLDPTYSVLRYIKQMIETSGLSQAPIFHSVKLEFVVDSELNLLKFITDEVYDVHMVIDAKDSHASLTQTFTYGAKNIPSLDEDAIYE